jgi:hypothetical protein
MLTVIETTLVDRQLALGKKKSTICLNALKNVLSETVEIYKGFSLHCNFQELIAASILYLETCVTQAPDLILSKEMVLDAAQELEKSCRRCLSRILFEKEQYDLEVESVESGIRLSALQIASMIRELDLGKEDFLLEKNQVEIDGNFQSLKDQLTKSLTRVVRDSMTSLRFIDKRDPALSLLVTSQGYIGYLIGVISRITRKEIKFVDGLLIIQ